MRDELIIFATKWHDGQLRKYTFEPYINHCIEVADMAEANNIKFGFEIGLFHDLLEDTSCTIGHIYNLLISMYSKGDVDFIVDGVVSLTDIYIPANFPHLNRLKRRTLEAERLASILPIYQSVKYCDLISNTKSIVAYDFKFATTFLAEKHLILGLMNRGDVSLYNEALKDFGN